MLEFNEALLKMLEPLKQVETWEVSLFDAPGRILREDIVADSDVPFTSNSAMDGYAVMAADTSVGGSPVKLKVTGEVPAGYVSKKAVASGEALRIFTGAPVPDGADAVVMQENTERQGDDVLIMKPVVSGENVRESGEDIRKDAVVFKSGRRLGPADVGIIASCGKQFIKVSRKPVVGILSTGNEVIEPEEAAGPGKVRNSNAYTLYAKCMEAGAEPRYLGIIPDEKAALRKALENAAENCDLLITSGGVSVGDYDHVTEIIREIGKIDFWKIAIKPGKPVAYGAVGDIPFVGLPGNPVSSMITFEMFVRPMILKMSGAVALHRKRLKARMSHEYIEKAGRLKFVRGIYNAAGEGLEAGVTGAQGSGVLMSMALANCLILIPSETGTVSMGDLVEIIPLDIQ